MRKKNNNNLESQSSQMVSWEIQYDKDVKCSVHFDSQVELSKSGCLDFGDLPAGSAKSLPLKLLNRTHATMPIRLVISAVSQHFDYS